MNKKKLSIILSVIIILQLAFPVGSVIYSKSFEKSFDEKGEIFKMKLTSVYYYSYSPVDDAAFLRPSIKQYDDCTDYYISNGYVEVTEGEDGFARYKFNEKKPKTNSYIMAGSGKNSFDIPGIFNIESNCYEGLSEVVFMTDYDGYEETVEGVLNSGAEEIYLEVKIYKGKIQPLAIYVDSMNIEDTLSLLSEHITQTNS